MPKLWTPGDPSNNQPETGLVLPNQTKVTPKPMMTARVAGKLTEAVKQHVDIKFNPDNLIDELRAEYDFRIKTGKNMCDPGMHTKCKDRGDCPWCSWKNYLECNVRTLNWRKTEMVQNRGTWGGMALDIEIDSVHHVIDLTVKAITNYLNKQGSSLKD